MALARTHPGGRKSARIRFDPRIKIWLLALCLLMPPALRADDIPPRPAQYFTDEAHVVDAATAAAFNTQLAGFERQTSNQILVAVYPSLQSDDALDDYCYRVAQAWGVGQKSLNNGAVLFVFVQDHKMRIETGYGLEGALPDITCVRILDDEMAPYFKQGDYATGLQAGINAIIAAAKGEYKGTGETAADKREADNDSFNTVFCVLFLILWLFLFFRKTRGILYGSTGMGSYGGSFLGGGGGGFSSGGGGGFSSGGGSFGGGGASGSW
jgi:uncharacterized protein